MHVPKSILLHIDGSARCAQRIRVARQLAETFDAQVTALYDVTPSLLRYPMAVEVGVVADLTTWDDECRDRARAAFDAERGGSSRLQWSTLDGDAPWGFAKRAFYTDLILLGQRDASDPAVDELPPDFLPSVLVESGRPALVLPFAGPIAPIGRTVLVAWKASRESARALSAALPWLACARRVHAVAYGDDADAMRASLASLQGYLQVQGVEVTLHVGGPEQADVGASLLSLTVDVGADLLVMGCYGHSRAREWVFGGATRSVLQTMTVPVLMAH